MNGIDTQLRVIDEADLVAADTATWSAASSLIECVSLYLPTHRAGREVTQDRVLFRRLVASGAEEITDGELLTAAGRLVDVASARYSSVPCKEDVGGSSPSAPTVCN